MPFASKHSRNTSEISGSRNGTSRSAASTRATSVPSAVKIEAYSDPTGPPPMTTSRSGIRSVDRMVSLSCTSGSSKGIAEGRSGLDPVAIRTTPAVRVLVVPSSLVTTTFRSGLSDAVPWMSSIPWRSMLWATEAVITRSTSASRVNMRSNSRSDDRPSPSP